MKKIGDILRNTEFESSSTKTQQFKDFVKVFKTEFNKEMKKVGATDIKYSIGHFDISGFFNIGSQIYYFSSSDIRGCNYRNENSLMYRTAKNHKDFTGGSNQWVTIGEDMSSKMNLY